MAFVFQGFELLKISLNDDSEKVCCAARQVFLPSFALWAVHLHKLEYELLHSFLRELEDLVKALPSFCFSALCLALQTQLPLPLKHIIYLETFGLTFN